MEKHSKIFVSGHRGMVGSAILRNLKAKGYTNFLLKSSSEVDLRDQRSVQQLFLEEKPEYVFLAAAKVGGIMANNLYRADFLYDNLMITTNVINSAYKFNTKKLLFLGSSCIYPKLAEQPIRENSLLTGPLEYTNEPYAIAKIAGIKLCENYRIQHQCNFISAMPTNLYGPNDNFDLNNSHVLPALLRKVHEAKINKETEVEIWGTGTPKREFLYVDDLAEACYFLMKNYNEKDTINIGYGEDLSIKELAETIAQVVGYNGSFSFNEDKPDGTPRKLMDSSRINKLGWKPSIDLRTGIKSTYVSVQESEILST